MTSPTLGVALITKNAARRLPECLTALAFADRIVVLDSGSDDDTVAIARAHGALVEVSPDWPGFGVQKNRALALLDTDWLLLIDADEVVTPELAASIRAVLANPAHAVYALNRLSSFCGHWMRHAGWFPDWIPRLFRRGAARFSDDLVHERLLFEGGAGRLDGLLLHYSYEDHADVLRKLDAYSTAGARQRFARGQRGGLGKAILRGGWAFVRTYFIKRGFLDGAAGFQVAMFNAETVYYRFLKLAAMEREGRGARNPKS
ncbi:LPS biosynthesis [Chitiniphilus shinanonensis]|uniref:LPS biosynthesis n=1 Tax=Chitiniphilus shinanonensis TaxID=553088 RepID=A0ABQ6BVI7_9NEIS|nr:glycosyltransferase family 2 protein [Chitiniphilus shinanonensis]GLS06000.1 LPS biosynthesis [Chitiniphilus shinanonensis]